jgi:hypothetical protein
MKKLSRRRFLGATAGAAVGIASLPAATVASGQATPAGGHADAILRDTTLVLTNGRIHTMDARNTIARTSGSRLLLSAGRRYPEDPLRAHSRERPDRPRREGGVATRRRSRSAALLPQTRTSAWQKHAAGNIGYCHGARPRGGLSRTWPAARFGANPSRRVLRFVEARRQNAERKARTTRRGWARRPRRRSIGHSPIRSHEKRAAATAARAHTWAERHGTNRCCCRPFFRAVDRDRSRGRRVHSLREMEAENGIRPWRNRLALTTRFPANVPGPSGTAGRAGGTRACEGS